MMSSLVGQRLAAVGAFLLAVAMVPVVAATAQDQGGRTVLDFDLGAAGVSDPVEVSVLFSRSTFASADDAIVTTSADGADALASGSLQGGVGGAGAIDVDGNLVMGRPLFYVDPQVGPEQALLDELARLGVTSLIVLGGEEAVPARVVDQFRDAGVQDIIRLGGSTRIETAVAIASYVVDHTDAGDGPITAFLTRAFGTATDADTAFADATALGGWAAQTGRPILLTASDHLSPETEQFLRSGAVSDVVIVGGSDAVGHDVERTIAEQIGLPASRSGSGTRAITAVVIAHHRGFESAADAGSVILTEGYAPGFFVNAFAAAAHSGVFAAPIVLSDGEAMPNDTRFFLERTGPSDVPPCYDCPPPTEDPTPSGSQSRSHAQPSPTPTPSPTATSGQQTPPDGPTPPPAPDGVVGVCGTDLSAELCAFFADLRRGTATSLTLSDGTPRPTDTASATATASSTPTAPSSPVSPSAV
jgi:hypothetical protein